MRALDQIQIHPLVNVIDYVMYVLHTYIVPVAGYASQPIPLTPLQELRFAFCCKYEPLSIICMNYYHDIVRDCDMSEAHL